MLASPLRRHIGDSALEDLQEGLLHTLTADVAGDAGVVRLACDLVDLVDVDDSALSAGDVEIGGLDESQQDVLDVLADVAGLGQRGGVGAGEGNVDDLGKRLCQQRLAAAGGPHQQDVGLLQLHVTVGLGVGDALVVVEDRHGEHLLGMLLADDVLIKGGGDHLWVGDHPSLATLLRCGAVVLLEDLLAEVDALVADVHTRPGDQLAHLLLPLTAEGAPGVAPTVVALSHRRSPYHGPAAGAPASMIRVHQGSPAVSAWLRRHPPGDRHRRRGAPPRCSPPWARAHPTWAGPG